MRAALTLLTLALHVTLVAQGWETATPQELSDRLDRSAAQFLAMESYRVRTQIMAFRNATDPEPQETETSTVWTNGDLVKAEHMGLVSYQDKDLRVTIVPEERVLVVAEPQNFFDVLGEGYRMEVFKAAQLTKRTNAGILTYQAQFAKGSDYERIDFVFDEAGWLRRLECWWGRSVAVAPDQPLTAMITPKVVLSMERPISFDTRQVDLRLTQAIERDGNSLSPAMAYKGFELVDNRLHP